MAKAVTDRKRLLDAALDRALRGAPLEMVPGDWNSAASATVEWIWQGHLTLLGELRRDAGVRGEAALRQAYRDGAVVGILLLLAVALLIVVVRSLLQPLRTLRTAAFEVADRLLPQAIEQLRTTDGTPGQVTVEPVPVHSREEVGQVARAFDTVHVQAVRLAAEQAQLRSSLNEIFLSMSGRSQGLLERALRLIDDARAHAADPELLGLLGQLHCLATRMRRHSENLVALAGGTQRRCADVPVAVLDVFHAAVSEIEGGARVSVCLPPAAMVDGPVVTDLIHLIAELLDNATSAIPHDASVTLGGSLTDDNGLLVEVTDSGAGLSPDALATINARLASAPTLDPMDPPAAGQMGLFVVRELATPHGITVRLRQRTGDSGITATALLPPTLIRLDLHVPAQGVPAENAPASSGWDDAQGQLPLQVSVIDRADATDLFSPASISPGWLGAETSPPGRPRTAQEEWLELFGSEPHPELHAERDRHAEPLTGIPPVGESHEVREEIFEMVSAWFREQQSASVNDTLPTIQPDWRSPLDVGWEAAQALRHPIDHGLTEAGLPKRQPRAHLVSDADSQVASMPVSAGPVRSPEDVRNRLSRYQRGLRVGRHARIGPDEPLTWTDTLAHPFGDDYGASEEYQQ
jgi:signal transduction histidine kinase